MKPLRIEFAPRSLNLRQDMRRSSPLVWLALAGGLLLCLSAAYVVLDLAGQDQAGSAELQRIAAQGTQGARTNQSARNDAATKIPPAQAAAVNGAVSQLNLPWHDLLDAIEAATPQSIALLALEPDARRQTVKGLAEARDSDAMLGYVATLSAQPFFTSVLLSKHETNTQDPNRPLRFQFEARWGQAVQTGENSDRQENPQKGLPTESSSGHPPRGFPQESPVAGLPSGHKQ